MRNPSSLSMSAFMQKVYRITPGWTTCSDKPVEISSCRWDNATMISKFPGTGDIPCYAKSFISNQLPQQSLLSFIWNGYWTPFRYESRERRCMKIKIIKCAERHKTAATVSAGNVDRPNKGEKVNATETIRLWIDEMRKTKEREQSSFQKVFGKEHCT